MSAVGAPLSHQELLELTRLLRISFRNTAKRPHIKSRDRAYKQTAKLLEMVEFAPDIARKEMRNARLRMARDKR